MRVEFEAAGLAAQEAHQMIERAAREAACEVHRDHRAMKAYHCALLDDHVQKKGRVGEAKKNLGRARESGEIEQRQEAAAPVATACAEDGPYLRVREVGGEFLGAVAIGTGEDSVAIERVLRNSDLVTQRGENADATLEMLVFHSGGCRHNANRIAGSKRGRFDQIAAPFCPSQKDYHDAWGRTAVQRGFYSQGPHVFPKAEPCVGLRQTGGVE